jgi:hypothetical protein
MMKNQSENEKTCQSSGASLLNVCMDCIFWYQCRRGTVDCHIRSRQASHDKIKA